MWINYLKTSFRSIWREKLYSIINLLGLSIGLAALLIVYLFVHHELSYDRFHKNTDRLYIVNHVVNMDGRDSYGSLSTAMGVGPEMKARIPGIESTIRIASRNVAVRRDKLSFEEFIQLVDPEFFDAFSFPIVKGEARNAFEEKSSIAITESYRDKMFEDKNVIGQSLFIKMGGVFNEYIIKAVLADPPSNSTIQFSILIPYENIYNVIPKRYDTSWGWYYPNTYILAENGITEKDLASRMSVMDGVVNTPESIERIGKISYKIQPVKDIHLRSEYPDLFIRTSKPLYSLILTLIGLLILTVALVNYTTLSVGRSVSRSKEVGIRKVVGASTKQIRNQFLFESILLTFIAFPIALSIAQIAGDTILDFLVSDIELKYNASLFIAGFMMILGVGSIAGMYPSMILSNKKPQGILKSYSSAHGGNKILKYLTVVQFAFSVILLVVTLGILSQLNFLQNKDLGYNNENVCTLRTAMDSRLETLQHYEKIRERFLSLPEVESVGACSNSFGFGWGKITYLDNEENRRICFANQVDEGFISTLGIKLKNGRNFSEDIQSDEVNSVILNEAYAKEMGWTNPVGQKLPGQLSDYEVIGMIEDFHFASLHEAIQPLILVEDGSSIINNVESTEFFGRSLDVILLKLNSADMASTISNLEAVWQDVSPEQPFVYWFLDEQYEWLYNMEIMFGKIAKISSLLTLIIAGMGMFGLTALNVSRRTKEIGIRKVLGATSAQVLSLFLNDFLRLILVASVAAWPLAYFAMHLWLEGFAFKTAIGWMWFITPTMILLSLTVLTVLLQTYKIANSNPANSIKYE